MGVGIFVGRLLICCFAGLFEFAVIMCAFAFVVGGFLALEFVWYFALCMFGGVYFVWFFGWGVCLGFVFSS